MRQTEPDVSNIAISTPFECVQRASTVGQGLVDDRQWLVSRRAVELQRLNIHDYDLAMPMPAPIPICKYLTAT